MTTITREHLEDEVLKSIQKKAESIMPKDAKVILSGQGLEGMLKQIPTGTSLCF